MRERITKRDLDILAASNNYRREREGIPAIYCILIKGLNRKAPMENHIPVL